LGTQISQPLKKPIFRGYTAIVTHYRFRNNSSQLLVMLGQVLLYQIQIVPG